MVTFLIILAVVAGIYVAWNIGANDVANAVGTSVGSGALTLKQAVLIAAVFEFAGAFIFGGSVSETVESGIVKPELFTGDKMDYVFGMLGSLIATGIWIQIASYFGLPISTTHSIIGAVLGFGLVWGGFDSIYWDQIGSIILSWLISPLLGGAFAYIIFSTIRHKILYKSNPILSAKKLTPYFVFVVFALLSLIILFNGLKELNLHLGVFSSSVLAIIIGGISSTISFYLVKRIQEPEVPQHKRNFQMDISIKKAQKHLERVEASSSGEFKAKTQDILKEIQLLSEEVEPLEVLHSEYLAVEKIFIYLQIIIACFMAFAHGSNDVANAIGPLAAVINVLQGKSIHVQSIPVWLLFLGGIGIVVGLATWGWRVIDTVGKKITELTPSRGFSAGFGAAITIMMASKLGLPISTTHVIVGAVLGVGFARGIGAINLNTIRDILISWIVTVPAGALLSAIFFLIFKALF